jgi:CheY-like chemotaxis protein
MEVPIIFLTANADEPTIERAKRTNPFGYLLKPFEERDLQTAIGSAETRIAPLYNFAAIR